MDQRVPIRGGRPAGLRRGRWAVLAAACAVAVSGSVLAGTALATTSPVQLLLPQGDAFAVLGHSCGGIQEQVFATQFDPVSDFPDGVAYLSTRCGGSGRGGGYTTTTYSAWVGIGWDLTGAVVSYNRLAAVPATDPTLVVTDPATQNELENLSNSAFLVYGPGFVPAPRVTGLSVTAGPAGGGTTVTISGTGFTGATAVDFGAGNPSAAVTVNGDTSITASAPAAAPGPVDVTVTGPGGTSASSSADTFTFVALPVVSSLTPSAGPLSGGTVVVISGSGLSGATAVLFGDAATSFTVDGDSSITAYAPASDSTTPDTVSVTVTTVGGTSVPGGGAVYSYTSGGPPAATDSVSGVSPASGPAAGGTKVKISGSGFTGATAVTFGGQAAGSFTVDSDVLITAVSPPDAVPGQQGVDVQVVVPGGTSAPATSDVFTYLPASVASVRALRPASGPVAGGTRVKIRGRNLQGATVTFGGVPATRVVVKRNGKSLTAVVPPEVGTGTVSVDVTVATMAGSVTLPAAFTYTG